MHNKDIVNVHRIYSDSSVNSDMYLKLQIKAVA